MNNFDRLRWQVKTRILGMMLADVLLVAFVWSIAKWYFGLADVLAASISIAAGVLLSYLSVEILTDISLDPLKSVWQAIIHVDPDHQGTPAPNLDKVRLGRDLVTSMTLQIYQFASQQDSKDMIQHRTAIIQAANIVSHLPLPLFACSKDRLVTHASDAGIKYCAVESSALLGKPIFDSLNLEFQSDLTLEKWMAECQESKVTDNAYWERVRVVTPDGTYHQCDLSAFYNRENSSGTEFIITLFDHTEQYNQDDQSLGFIALAVHELRTPLTMLRGYIEVFDDELRSKLTPELQGYMLKMQTSADQLTAFVHNILQIARIDNNQLTLHLVEADWNKTVHAGAAAMELKAQVSNKVIEYEIDPKLPSVAVDTVTIQEVINNLLDNAIKYSPDPKSTRIIIRSALNKDGLVETTVQDFGTGIPESVLPSLFEKFHRNHRTRGQVTGTGLGLYLCKMVVDAHGGQIWAKSKEGEGSTFGFTLVPFNKLADEKKGSGDIVRQANGWIKNHSYYRR